MFKTDIIKNTIKYLVALALICGLTVLLDHIFIPKYISENQDGRITGEFYRQTTDMDVIFLGASTVHYAISPDYMWGHYGFSSYDRSNASQTIWQSYYMLEDTLKFKRPSLVMLDVSFMKNGQEFIEEPSNRKTIEAMKDPVAKYGAVMSSKYFEEQPLSYYFPILRYHSRWKELKAEDYRYAFASPDVTYEGYIMDFTIPEEQSIYPVEDIEFADFPEKSMVYLYKIIELCKKENIKLVLMKTPTYVNNWHREYDERLNEIALENNLTYINFVEYDKDMDLKVRVDFIDDGEHMNVSGAEKFSNYLGKYITNNFDLPVHDEGFNSIWQQKYERYENAVNAGMPAYEKTCNLYD